MTKVIKQRLTGGIEGKEGTSTIEVPGNEDLQKISRLKKEMDKAVYILVLSFLNSQKFVIIRCGYLAYFIWRSRECQDYNISFKKQSF